MYTKLWRHFDLPLTINQSYCFEQPRCHEAVTHPPASNHKTELGSITNVVVIRFMRSEDDIRPNPQVYCLQCLKPLQHDAVRCREQYRILCVYLS